MITRVLRACVIGLSLIVIAGCGEPRGVAAVGSGPEYQPPSLSREVASGAPVGALRCTQAAPKTWIHLELFAHGRVVIVPAGIGVAPPRTVDGAYVRGGRCRYPLFTTEPTGLVAVADHDLTLGDLFRVWDRPLSRDVVAGFRGRVRVHVDGGRWKGDPADVPLAPHAQIVVQAGGPLVEPHAAYRFPEGH
jgi:hypothetical protein